MTALSRTRLRIGDPDRSWFYSWNYDGGMGGIRQKLSVSEWDYDAGYHGLYRPVLSKPGLLTVDVGTPVRLNVLPALTKRPAPAPVTPGTSSASAIASYVVGGYNVITLAPGEHVLDRPVSLPAGTTLRGRHATVNWSGANPAFFTGDDVSLYGITFHPDIPAPVTYAGGPNYDTGLVAGFCTFRRCDLGYWHREAYVYDSRFESAGCGIAPAGLHLRNVYTGPAYEHAFKFGAGLGPVAVVDCIFDGSDRGLIASASTPISDSLHVGNVFQNICRTLSGCENGLVEGGALYSRALYLHTRMLGCSSTLLQTNNDGVTSDILVRDLYVDGGPGIVLWGASHQRITLQDFELRNGAGIYCDVNVRQFQAVNGDVVAWAPTRGSEPYPNPSPVYGYNRVAACVNLGGPTNTLANVRISTLPGYTPVQGFAVK